MKKPFYGRSRELGQLESIAELPGARLIVIKGRRRIGKSRLAMELGKRHPERRTYYLTGVPPRQAGSAEAVLDDFAGQISRVFGIPRPNAKKWDELLWHIADRVKGGNAILILDEINWLGRNDPDFSSRIWLLWETELSKLDKFILILSGSLTGWIDDKFSSNTGYVGRISWNKTLQELPIPEAKQFFGKRNERLSAAERLKLLMITGGVPRYLEEIKASETADENIRRLCFTPGGLLVNEYDQLLNDLFQRKNKSFRRIIEALAERPMTLAKLHRKLEMSKSGVLSARVTELEKAGFLSRFHTWDTHTGEAGNQYKIRVTDNYVRFYLKCILPYAEEIEAEEDVFPSNMASMLGYQFENLVLKNRRLLLHALKIQNSEIVKQGPYFQNAGTKQKGCQIDYLIQTRQALFVIEIKFLNEPIGPKVLRAVREKERRLSKPKGLSVRPVLVHVNGVMESVRQADYFDKIIDFGELAFGD